MYHGFRHWAKYILPNTQFIAVSLASRETAPPCWASLPSQALGVLTIGDPSLCSSANLLFIWTSSRLSHFPRIILVFLLMEHCCLRKGIHYC